MARVEFATPTIFGLERCLILIKANNKLELNFKALANSSAQYSYQFAMSSNYLKSASAGKGKVIGLTSSMAQMSVKDAPIVCLRSKPSACVFVASLDMALTDKDLAAKVEELFKKWGTIISVKVLRDTSKHPYAFVQYTNDEDSARAIKNGNLSKIDSRPIRCEAAKINRTLFIQCDVKKTKEIIETELLQFGEIQNLSPSTKKGSATVDDNSPCQYWYCKFLYREDAIKAYAILVDTDKYKVDWAQNIDSKINEKFEAKYDKFSIFVSQNDSNLDETSLRERFERHGKIVSIQIVNKDSKSFAFIKYTDESGAANAIERENHALYKGKSIYIQYREYNVGSKISTNTLGVPLAPPPIHLNRKQLKPIQVNDNINNNNNRRNDGGKSNNSGNNKFSATKPNRNNKFIRKPAAASEWFTVGKNKTSTFHPSKKSDWYNRRNPDSPRRFDGRSKAAPAASSTTQVNAVKYYFIPPSDGTYGLQYHVGP